MTHEQLKDAHIAALREIVDQRAEIGRLKAQLATAKGEVWESVMTHIREIPSDPHMTSTGALLLLHRWAREQKEAL